MSMQYQPQPEQLPNEFHMVGGGFGRFVLPFVAPLVLFFAVMLLLGAVLVGSVGGIAVGLVTTAALVGVLVRKYRTMLASTTVRFSPAGVELFDNRGVTVQVRWPDITRLDAVQSRMASPRRIGRPLAVHVRAGAMSSSGLIGWGERNAPARLPGWMRRELAAQPVHPQDGRQEVAIPLGAIDPHWTHGAMGAWVRLYRPDLLPPSGRG